MTKTLAFILSASLAACAGEAEVRYSGDATTPELVAMDSDPGVMVVANADEPIFYTDNSYWLFRGDHWYRSSSHRDGWARVSDPPEHVRRIERPAAYVHYRRGAGASRTTYNERRPEVAPPPTESRERPAPPPQPQPPQRPVEMQRPEPAPRPEHAPPGPTREPNPQGPQQPPHANPLPPQQVPPANADQHDGPDHRIAPDPDRAPVSPGMRDRATDQRPANDRDDRRPEDRRPDDKN